MAGSTASRAVGTAPLQVKHKRSFAVYKMRRQRQESLMFMSQAMHSLNSWQSNNGTERAEL